MTEESSVVEVGGEDKPIRWLLGRLWNCTDVLAAVYCQNLEIPVGSTYAVAVRDVMSKLGEEAE
ncbi:hypothetical protein [Capsulimonas corticalis]|uniref:hypothetical protein n=1 Tax=Capsulimonas corticalis TaxID=2219043 RepID=UPI000F653571|nr:hypothetical protein [Capsulimonas corticalis]